MSVASSSSSVKITTKHELSWAVGSIATGAVTNAVAIFALFFLTSQLGVEAGVAGLLIFSTKIYDAISDPIMGRISDNWQGKKGRRSPFLLWGSIILGVSFFFFFNLPSLKDQLIIPLIFILLICISTGYTIFAVPYLALSPDLAPTYDKRTRLMSFRVFFLMMGVLVGAVLAPKLVDFGGGYSLMGAIIGSIVIVAGLIAYLGVRKLDSELLVPERHKESLAQMIKQSGSQFLQVFKTKPFALLTLVKLLQFVVLATVLASFPYFFTFVMKKTASELGTYMGLFSISGIIAIPFIRMFIKAVGKRNAYVIFLLLYSAGLFSWYIWTPNEPMIGFYARAILIGVVSTGTLFCALSLLPDTMEYDRLTSGVSREGTMSGVFTLVEKFASALGPLIVGTLLQTSGLITSRDPATIQPEAALNAIHLAASVIPAVITLLCIPVLLKYRLTADMLESSKQD